MSILDHVKIAQKLRELGFEPVEGSFLGEGEANIGANVGDGTGLVYRNKTGVTLNFRTIKEDPANPGMIITTDGDTILLGTPAGTGNVVGTPPSVADGVATYDGTTGLLIDGPDTKLLTATEELSETAPKDRPVQYMLMKTSDGTAWAEIIRYGISAAGSFDNNIRIGPEVQFAGQDNTITMVVTKDPLVKILGVTSGKMMHEGMQEIWEIKKEGTISQLTGADTAILTLKNGNATTFTVVKIKAGNILPESNVNGANGDRYYYRDAATPANSTEYIFRGSSPGLTGWEELGGGGGVTAHSALTGLVAPADDHTQYALLAGRAGGQKLTGGDGGTDSLELKATSGTGASGSNVDLLVGDDGDILAMRAAYNGMVGIGTIDPQFRLSIADDGGIVAEGNYAAGIFLPSAYEGAGTRLLWYPRAAAFRAGRVTGVEWNAVNIGPYSFATGSNTIASGVAATSIGVSNTASGVYATCIGRNNLSSGSDATCIGRTNAATGEQSSSIGYTNVSSGDYSTTIGWGCNASGEGAAAIGIRVAATGDSAFAAGQDCTASGADSIALGQGIEASGSNSVAIALGNSSAVCSQNNSMCIMEGEVGIETITPAEKLHVVGSIRMADGFEGIGRVSTCKDANGTQKWLNPNPVLERTSNYTATVLDRTIICEDTLTVTLPVTGIEDGHVFKIKNAVGVTYGSGDTGDVTVSITGTTVKFDKTSSNSRTLIADGWVLVCQWSSSASTYWITQLSLETPTGSPT